MLSTFHSLSVGPVSPLIASDGWPSVMTKPQDSTGWLTGIDCTVYGPTLNVLAGA